MNLAIFFFVSRFNIAADLVDEAKSAGQLGFAGILVWMRFMATRQLVWNKNYNVKPRYSSNNVTLIGSLDSVHLSYSARREILANLMGVL